MIPSVPVPVWEQISIVIVYSFLLAGLSWTGTQAVIRVSQYLAADAATKKQVEIIQRCLEERRELWQKIIDHLDEMSRTEQEILTRLETLRLGQASLAQALETRPRRAKGSPRHE